MVARRIRFALVLVLVLGTVVLAQSGAGRARTTSREYGVNLTFAVYQFDASRSPAIEEVTRLPATFSSAEEEIAYLKDKYKLEEVEVRHIRPVGLLEGESFTDAVLLGPEYMVFAVDAEEVARGRMKLGMKVKYANEALLDVTGLDLGNFETVVLRGGRGMFGVKYFVGAGGRQESAPIERTLLVSVTPEISPGSSLRNRPGQLSRPVDEHGGTIETQDEDRFTPPVPLKRVVPKFDAGRRVQGSVLLAGVVTPEGKIINVRVARSLDPAIDERAVDAFRQYEFSPALLNGKQVYATYQEELTFAASRPSLREVQDEIERQREKNKENEKDKRRRRRRFPFPTAPWELVLVL